MLSSEMAAQVEDVLENDGAAGGCVLARITLRATGARLVKAEDALKDLEDLRAERANLSRLFTGLAGTLGLTAAEAREALDKGTLDELLDGNEGEEA